MDNPDGDTSTLSELGLSMLQAKVYLSLIRSKDQTAQSIASISGVARPDIYRILVGLEKAGLVERVIAKPAIFRAVPIDCGLSNLIYKRIRRTEEIRQKIPALINKYKDSPTIEEADDKTQFALIPKRKALYNKIEGMINRAQTCICLLGPTNKMLFWLSNYRSTFEKALHRNVTFRAVLSSEDPPEEIELIKTLSKNPNFTLKYITESPKAAFYICDKKEILISTSTNGAPDQSPALWSKNKSLVDFSQDYFERIWIDAKEN